MCMSDPEVKSKKPGQKERLGYCFGLYDYFKKKQSKGEVSNFQQDTDLGHFKFLPDI